MPPVGVKDCLLVSFSIHTRQRPRPSQQEPPLGTKYSSSSRINGQAEPSSSSSKSKNHNSAPRHTSHPRDDRPCINSIARSTRGRVVESGRFLLSPPPYSRTEAHDLPLHLSTMRSDMLGTYCTFRTQSSVPWCRENVEIAMLDLRNLLRSLHPAMKLEM